METTVELQTYTLPTLLIKEAKPTLEKNGVVYAHLITMEDETGINYEMLERRGLPMQEYVGKITESILEVLYAEFFFPETQKEIDNLPKDILKGTYQWEHSGYKFIPELLEMIEGHQNDENYNYDEDEYDRIAEDYFTNWGNTGMGLAVYQNKPMVQTENGVFLFNEYRFEDIIEEWNLHEVIYFRPKEMLLRGLKVVDKKFKKKQGDFHSFIFDEPLKPNEMLIRGRPKILK